MGFRVCVCVMHKRERGCFFEGERYKERTLSFSLSLSSHHKHNTGASVKNPRGHISPQRPHTLAHSGDEWTHTCTYTHTHSQLMVCVTEQHLRWSSSLDGGMQKTTDTPPLLLLLLSSSSSFFSSPHYSAIRLADATHCLNGAIRGLGVSVCVCVRMCVCVCVILYC